jgi:hypothetical protein
MQKRLFYAADSHVVGLETRHSTGPKNALSYSQQLTLNIIMFDMNTLTITYSFKDYSFNAILVISYLSQLLTRGLLPSDWYINWLCYKVTK